MTTIDQTPMLKGSTDELETDRLLQEGVDSGPGIEVTPAFWAELKAEIKGSVASKRRLRCA